VYKIKKPTKYSFLDFLTLELRQHFCEKELELNQRFSKNIYIEVPPICKQQRNYSIGDNGGTLVDFALKMRKLDPEKQMDVLVSQNMASEPEIKNLAERIADFHKNTTIICEKNVLDVRDKFSDLMLEKEFLSKHLGPDYGNCIDHAIKTSNTFLQKNKALLLDRLRSGFFRDCHADLHTRNIFLLSEPQLFDCIEFNDENREIDVLNELAFLCMDLDVLGKKSLSDLAIAHYDLQFPKMRTKVEHHLFAYYKGYRANVLAKVNSLRAKSASNNMDKMKALSETEKDLCLMDGYVNTLKI